MYIADSMVKGVVLRMDYDTSASSLVATCGNSPECLFPVAQMIRTLDRDPKIEVRISPETRHFLSYKMSTFFQEHRFVIWKRMLQPVHS